VRPEVQAEFHKGLYEDLGCGHGQGVQWMGVGALKYPCDLWNYQEILFRVKPDLLIETGTHMGGSALFMAHMMDIIGKGRVVSLDISHTMLQASHPRVTFLQGASCTPEMVERVNTLIDGSVQTIMVVLDSDHSRGNVLDEMNTYGPLVSPGSYMIVEDTNLGGHPVAPGTVNSAWDAVHEWLPEHPEFEIDKRWERFGVTFSPDGYLLKVN